MPMRRNKPSASAFLAALATAVLLLFAQGIRAQDAPAGSALPSPTVAFSGVAEITSNKKSAEVGEPITLTIKIPLNGEFEDVDLKLPDEQKTQFFISRKKVIGPTEFSVEVAPLHSGDLTLGPATVSVRAKGAKETTDMVSGTLQFKIAEPTAKAAPDERKDYSPPETLPFSYFYRNLIFVAAGVLILIICVAIFAYLFLRARKRVVITPPVKTLPPVDEALLQVRDLKKLETFTALGAEKHYTALSMTLRRYLQETYQVNATERTEDEIVHLLRTTLQATPLANTLVSIMQRMSLAKFAKQEPTGQVAFEDCTTAENFLLSEKNRVRTMASSPSPPQQEGQAA
ncbi:hypothetical protein IT570_07905 [Candidatus Sumerlaeota bacterium]|nr:hypothetical protein [Candidatus Sumerlaeota bacterium]